MMLSSVFSGSSFQEIANELGQFLELPQGQEGESDTAHRLLTQLRELRGTKIFLIVYGDHDAQTRIFLHSTEEKTLSPSFD